MTFYSTYMRAKFAAFEFLASRGLFQALQAQRSIVRQNKYEKCFDLPDTLFVALYRIFRRQLEIAHPAWPYRHSPRPVRFYSFSIV